MAERHVTALLAAIEETALRDCNVELAALQAALASGTVAEAARARQSLLDAVELFAKAHELLWVLRREEEDEGG